MPEPLDIAVILALLFQTFIIAKQAIKISNLESKLRFYKENRGVRAATSRHC